MQIEIKDNTLIIEFSKAEKARIIEKAGSAELANISNYLENKIIKALGLDNLNDANISNVGKDFNLNKIKTVSLELKKRTKAADSKNISETKDNFQTKTGAESKTDLETMSNLDVKTNPEPEIAHTNLAESPAPLAEPGNAQGDKLDAEITAEIGDELLADLLDKDLLKKQSKSEEDQQSL